VESINLARRELAAQLGVGPVDESAETQTWTVDGCRLVLSNESDDFELELRPSGSR
jgi:hypothetical protein